MHTIPKKVVYALNDTYSTLQSINRTIHTVFRSHKIIDHIFLAIRTTLHSQPGFTKFAGGYQL